MACCTPYISTGNSAFTDQPYTEAMRAIYGPVPKIEVLYLNEEGNYVFAGNYTLKQFSGDRILIDHGGQYRWLLKVS